MKKRFNITGRCDPKQHYMMDNTAKVQKVLELVQAGMYFVINRPRQYGKTTTLFAVEEQLLKSQEYFPIRLNFQGVDDKCHESSGAFAQMFVEECIKYLKYTAPSYADFLKQHVTNVQDINRLSALITDFVHFCPKKLVLLIDEVDASANYQPFLTFLGMLRTKYLDRDSPHNYTFHSVVLVGVHDVKSLKFKIRNPDEAQYNSPWNIAIDFDSEMEFNPEEIAPMLVEYAHAENIQMDVAAIAERLYYYTAGYPFLVSRLCQLVAEKVLPKKPKAEQHSWTLDDVEAAVQLIYNEVNTNFESLIKNLQNHQDLYDLVFAMLINGQTFAFNPDNETIRKGVIYGVFQQNGKLKIHNRIYEQRIYNYLVSTIETSRANDFSDTESAFVLPNGGLDMERVLRRFQAYMRESDSRKEQGWLERHWRLLFLAYLRPILNGKGYDYKEVSITDERRLDVVLTYGRFRYIVELKVWRGEEYHVRGIEQLRGYLESQGSEVGYLVIFDARRKEVGEAKWLTVGDKKIFAVWI
ncbi:MAG: AAA-like domain-containing protein [Flammeovirgaceae bacterium]|nr:AAA-like domain-containing protein [Flammeovirgaceae bacterium]